MVAIDKYTRTTEVLWRKRDGMATLSERGPRPLPGQVFIAFPGTLQGGWSSFTMHQFTLSGYILQITKERMLLITSKKEDVLQTQGGKWLNWLHSILERFSTDFRKLL